MRRIRRDDPDVSVVVPIVDRYGDLKQLYGEFAAELERLGKSFEFIFVVDERLRQVLPTLSELQRDEPGEIVIVTLGGAFGESAALTLGLQRARGESIAVLAAYFQVDPRGLEDAFAALDSGIDLVAGRRCPRIDSWFNRLQSNLFHSFVRRLTSTDLHDISCGFKVMKRRVARELNIYGGLHRFIPILALHRGFTVKEIPLPQRREDSQTRVHGTAAYLGRLLDLLTIFFLMKFTRTPLRFFGLVGTGLFALGFLVDLAVAVEKIVFEVGISERPLLLLGVLLMVLGVQTLSLGLVGEIIIFTHARNTREYQVAEILRRPSLVGSVRDPVDEEPPRPAAAAGGNA
jgi:glycosyltransferase involved in cell wall biosynthesis